MKSCIYEGNVRHRRFNPIGHSFNYALYMLYLDLGELDAIFRRCRFLLSDSPLAPMWLRRSDHHGPEDESIETSVRKLIEESTGQRSDGPIRLLTHPRTWWMGFNPVSFYYCFDKDEQLQTIVAEVNNTPWLEQHPYVMTAAMNEGRGRSHRYRMRKAFHVSPFLSMDYTYDWRFSEPGRTLSVHMENLKDGTADFDATMSLNRAELKAPQLMRVLAQYPFMTAKVVGGIYWQALRLRLKGAPFFKHPHKAANPSKAG